MRSIMPMRPKPWPPAESIAVGLGVAVFGQFFSAPLTRYGFGAMGSLLVVLGAWDWWRARRTQ